MVYVRLKGFRQTLGYASGSPAGNHFVDYALYPETSKVELDLLYSEFFTLYGWKLTPLEEYVTRRGLDDHFYYLIFAVNIEESHSNLKKLASILERILKKSEEEEYQVINELQTELREYLCVRLEDQPDFMECGYEYWITN